MGKADSRRPPMDMGLGLWTDYTQRYYPRQVIQAQGNALLDRLDGRVVLIYIDAESGTPTAVYPPLTPKQITWQEGVLILDTGHRLERGQLIDSAENIIRPEMPLQMFTRWYGFAYTFPTCEVFELSN